MQRYFDARDQIKEYPYIIPEEARCVNKKKWVCWLVVCWLFVGMKLTELRNKNCLPEAPAGDVTEVLQACHGTES